MQHFILYSGLGRSCSRLLHWQQSVNGAEMFEICPRLQKGTTDTTFHIYYREWNLFLPLVSINPSCKHIAHVSCTSPFKNFTCLLAFLEVVLVGMHFSDMRPPHVSCHGFVWQLMYHVFGLNSGDTGGGRS